jgi:hypothetical protein
MHRLVSVIRDLILRRWRIVAAKLTFSNRLFAIAFFVTVQLVSSIFLYHLYTIGKLAKALESILNNDNLPDATSAIILVCINFFVFVRSLPTVYERFRNRITRIVVHLHVLIGILSLCFQLILMFASTCMLCGILDGEHITPIRSPAKCLYFSIVTWTTLGYGDYKPSETLQMWAAIEALIGYLFMALLVAVLVQTISFRENDPPSEYWPWPTDKETRD